MVIKDPTPIIDIHSHLVPGVDDGAEHVAGVVASVERFRAAGIHKIVTTPHIRGSLTLDPERIEARLGTVTAAFEEARAALSDHFPDFEYRRGHEVLVDVPEPDFSDPRIRMAGTSFVLIEWPRLAIPPNTIQCVRRIFDRGYRPIIAHPERYHGLLDRLEIAREWKEAGALLQVNYGSFVGRYGAEAQTAVFRLMQRGIVDYMASDFHGQSKLKIYKREAWEVLRGRGGEEILKTLCQVNPGRLLEDLDPLPAPALGGGARILDRIRDVIRLNDRANKPAR